MTSLCVIAAIGLHPHFVRVRPLRFRHDGGAVIARTEHHTELLSRAEAIARLRALDRDIDDHERSGRIYTAIQARADRRDLDVALRELCAFPKRSFASATARPSLCEEPRGT